MAVIVGDIMPGIGSAGMMPAYGEGHHFNGTLPMSKLDFLELDRILNSFFQRQDMSDAGYVIVFCDTELKLAVTSNVDDMEIVKGMLRGAARKVEEIEPILIDTTVRGNA